jgi:hypothetical protein
MKRIGAMALASYESWHSPVSLKFGALTTHVCDHKSLDTQALKRTSSPNNALRSSNQLVFDVCHGRLRKG